MHAASVVTDFTQYAGLRAGAATDDPVVLREVAGQFEALFVQTLLKNMRGAELAEPLFGSDQHDMYVEMMDKQLAVELSKGKGLGFAELLVKQLGSEVNGVEAGVAVPKANVRISEPAPYPKTERTDSSDWTTPEAFASDLWPHVKRVAAKLDVAPEALLAQAALETGWGSKVIRRGDGSNSYNLFGIKADPAWSGGSVTKSTLEYRDGVAHRVRAPFRAYPNVAAAFDDYATFVGSNPRYRAVLESAGDTDRFASALQAAGYATDPLYAAKISRIAGGDTLTSAIAPLKNQADLPIPSTAVAVDSGADSTIRK